MGNPIGKVRQGTMLWEGPCLLTGSGHIYSGQQNRDHIQPRKGSQPWEDGQLAILTNSVSPRLACVMEECHVCQSISVIHVAASLQDLWNKTPRDRARLRCAVPCTQPTSGTTYNHHCSLAITTITTSKAILGMILKHSVKS